MSQKILMLDDLDSAQEADAGTLVFGIDHQYYEIDLSKKNAEELRRLLGKYVKVGRPIGAKEAARRALVATSGDGTGQPPDPAVVRAWAKAKGKQVSDKGVVPADITAEYLASLQAQEPDTAPA